MEESAHPLSAHRRRLQVAADMQGYWSPRYGESRDDFGSSPSRFSLRGLRAREEVSRSPGRSPLQIGERNVAIEGRSRMERSLTLEGDSILYSKASHRHERWGGLRTSWLVKNIFEAWRSVHARRFPTETRLYVPEEETFRRPKEKLEELRELKVDVDINAIVSAVAEGLRVGPLEEMRLDLRRLVSQVIDPWEDLREEHGRSSARIGDIAREVRDVREEVKALVEGCRRDLLLAIQEGHDLSLRRAPPPPKLDDLVQAMRAHQHPKLDDLVQVGDIARIEDRLLEVTHAIDRIRTQTDGREILEHNGRILEAIESLEFSETAACIRRVRQDVAPLGEIVAKQQHIFLEVLESVKRMEENWSLEHSRVMESINTMEAKCHSNSTEVLRAVRTIPRESNQAETVVDAVQSALDACQRHIIHAIRDDVRLRFESLVVEDRHSEVLQAIHRSGEVFHDKHSSSLEHVVSQVHHACDSISKHLKREDGVMFSAVEKCESVIRDVHMLVRELLENSSNREDLLALQDAMQRLRRDTVKDIVERLEVAVDHSPMLEAISNFEHKVHSEVMNALKQIQLDLNMEPDFSPVLRALRDLPSAGDVQSVDVAVSAGTRKVLNALEAVFGSRAIPQDRSTSPSRRKYVVTLGAEPAASPTGCRALSPGMQELLAAGTTPMPQQTIAQESLVPTMTGYMNFNR